MSKETILPESVQKGIQPQWHIDYSLMRPIDVFIHIITHFPAYILLSSPPKLNSSQPALSLITFSHMIQEAEWSEYPSDNYIIGAFSYDLLHKVLYSMETQ